MIINFRDSKFRGLFPVPAFEIYDLSLCVFLDTVAFPFTYADDLRGIVCFYDKNEQGCFFLCDPLTKSPMIRDDCIPPDRYLFADGSRSHNVVMASTIEYRQIQIIPHRHAPGPVKDRAARYIAEFRPFSP